METGSKAAFYTICDTFLLRSPVLPLKVLDRISSAENPDEILKEYFSTSACQDALFLSSQGLYREALKFVRSGETSDKVKHKLMQYLIRMSSRCTPFGLFAGICTGRFASDGCTLLEDIRDHLLAFRPDMQLLSRLAYKVGTDHSIRENLKYYPNTSLFDILNEYRYLEYHTSRSGARKYSLNVVRKTPEIEAILEESAGGASFNELLNRIRQTGTGLTESKEFLHTLIDNQLLVAETEPKLTGAGYLEYLNSKLRDVRKESTELDLLDNISEATSALNAGSSDIKELIARLRTRMDDCGLKYDENAIVQADLKLNSAECLLPESIKQSLQAAISVLTRLSSFRGNVLMERFRERFSVRYGDEEVPLSLVMDAEVGPGYLPDDSLADNSALLDGLEVMLNDPYPLRLDWSLQDSFLYKKLQDCLISGQYEIKLNEKDLNELPDPGNDFPVSISMMVRIYEQMEEYHGERLIYLASSGGNSAINLAARFAYLDDKLFECLELLGKKERSFHKEMLLAEIVHLPEERTGNVLFRPVLNAYEIPFLAGASVEKEFVIPIEDILVSVRNNKVLLRSKRWNKYILPRLSNAHNYSLGRLSLYRFLCDLQSQDINNNLGFSWGPLEGETIFLPRVRYRNIILSPAQWHFSNRHLSCLKEESSFDSFVESLKKFRKKYNIPAKVLLTEYDNELWLDTNSRICQDILRQTVIKSQKLVIQEYLGSANNAIVRSKDGAHANEFLFFLYRDK